jgi:hypothetical protein
LPAEYVRTAVGVERRIEESYRRLWELSGQIRDWIHGQLELPDRETWTYDAALEILAANYRLGQVEANLLQQLGRAVLTTATVEPILVACCDWDLPQQLLDALEKQLESKQQRKLESISNSKSTGELSISTSHQGRKRERTDQGNRPWTRQDRSEPDSTC